MFFRAIFRQFFLLFSSAEALALLYVQSQNLTGKTPLEIYYLYYEAYEEIKEHRMKMDEKGIVNQPR